MAKALVILSGGQDSTTCLFWAKEKFKGEIHAITFDYNQRHKREIEAARKIASISNICTHEVIQLGGNILAGTSPLVSPHIVEKYKDVESLPKGIEPTFVPSRNSLFLVIAMNRAVALDCKNIVIGISQVDYGGYPDCRERYILDLRQALNEGIFGDQDNDVFNWINIYTPLLFKSKKETVELAVELGISCLDALAYSHTCYNGDYPPCSKCHSCLLRERGFKEAEIVDPLLERVKREGK